MFLISIISICLNYIQINKLMKIVALDIYFVYDDLC